MNKKTRLIILLFCVVCFLVIAPILVLYSMGYRFDFEETEVVTTGGIYVRTFPTAGQIIIDSHISEKPGMFSNSIFVQSLLPENHSVAIKKDGYYDYSKTLAVQEGQVTKLENVLLIKKSITFSDIADKIDYFSVAPNNQNIITAAVGAKNITFNYFSLNNGNKPKTFSVGTAGTVSDIKWSDNSKGTLIKINNSKNSFYYLFDSTLKEPSAIRLSYLNKNSQQISFSPQDQKTIFYIENSTLYSAKGDASLPIINNIISFKIAGTNIAWLSVKGVLSNSDLTGKLTEATSLKNFPVNGKKTYKIISISGNTYLMEDDSLFEFDQNTKTFKNFIIPSITSYKIINSGDNKNLIYWSKDKIYLYSLADNLSADSGQKKFQELFSGSQINNCQWLNNDYIIFASGDKTIISEIDYRGNINAITLPQTADKIFFNQQDGKLYILSNNTLLVSEKLLP